MGNIREQAGRVQAVPGCCCPQASFMKKSNAKGDVSREHSGEGSTQRPKAQPWIPGLAGSKGGTE